MEDAPQNEPLTEEPKRDLFSRAFWAFMFTCFLVIVSLAVAHSTSPISSREIPEPFRRQIADLHADQVMIAKQRQDLEKQISQLDAASRWDCERIDLIAGQALTSIGLSASDHRVNVDRMKVESIAK